MKNNKNTQYELNKGLAQMLKGGVIMDVTTPEQARIAEAAGACAVMALERIPADIRAAGGVSRMSDLVDNVRIEGSIEIDGENIYAPSVDTTVLRKKVGMVFQQPNPFPMSIYDNIAYGPRVHGIKDKKILDQIVEESLQGAAIFNEVKDRLKKSAMGLSGGQQQRLCIARALAVQPEVLLMDEPTSALDPISTSKIEELMEDLKKKYTVVVVTHNMQQAVRVSDDTAFFLVGDMVEFGDTKTIFSYPQDKRTEDYITGRFG